MHAFPEIFIDKTFIRGFKRPKSLIQTTQNLGPRILFKMIIFLNFEWFKAPKIPESPEKLESKKLQMLLTYSEMSSDK